MKTYCSGCKNHADNAYSKRLIIMANKEIKGETRYANCMPIKSLFDKIRNKSEQDTIVSDFSIELTL